MHRNTDYDYDLERPEYDENRSWVGLALILTGILAVVGVALLLMGAARRRAAKGE
jgi:hypothetical protein